MSTYTLKIEANGSVHRLSASLETPFEALLSLLPTPPPSSPPPSFTYRDEEGDVITISSSADLRECLTSLERAGLSSCRLILLTPPPSSAPAAAHPPSSSDEAPPSYDPESTPRLGAQKQGRRVESLGGGGGCCPFRWEDKETRLLRKLARKEAKAPRKLEKLRASPYFSQEAFLARMKELEGREGLPVFPFLEFLVAKEIVAANRQAAWRPCCCCCLFSERKAQWKAERRERKERKRIARVEEELAKAFGGRVAWRVRELEEKGLPGGFWLGVYLIKYSGY